MQDLNAIGPALTAISTQRLERCGPPRCPIERRSVGTSLDELAAARRSVEAHGLAPFGETATGFCVRDPHGHEVELYVETGRPSCVRSAGA